MTRFHFPPRWKQFAFQNLTSVVAMARKVIAVLSLNVNFLDRISYPNFISFDHCCSQWCVLQSALFSLTIAVVNGAYFNQRLNALYFGSGPNRISTRCVDPSPSWGIL